MGGTSGLGLRGVEPIVTEYWSYPLPFPSVRVLSGAMKVLDAFDKGIVANSLVMRISVVLKLVKGFSICTCTGRDG